MKKAIVLIIILAVLGYGGYRYYSRRQSGPVQAVSYRTSKVARGAIVQEITATGTVEPIKEVEVATQVTGKVTQLLADYNSHVSAGEKIATIDPDTYEASLASANARLKSSEAALERTKAHLVLAEKELLRQQKLAEKKMNSEAELDNAVATRDQLLADLKSNEASIEECKASLRQAKTNLDYCTIISPVTGIVISRSVDEGQTVVSSMNASPLYTIATDLSRMQVEASVPEADIGQVKVGQTVNFTVDAYKEKFTGKVVQIRLAATTVSNVVTYPVIVEAENPGTKLFPGMTANLSIIVQEANDIVLIPAAALRFKPDQGLVAAPPQGGMPGGKMPEGFQPPQGGKMPEGFQPPQGGKMPEGFQPPQGGMPGMKGGMPPKPENVVWLLESDNHVRPVPVQLGITDGVNQEILNAEDLVGKEVVLGIQKAKKTGEEQAVNTNPFAPKPPGGGKKGQRGGAGGPPPPGP